MYRPAHRHPLASFRFWFLVLGCVAATTAWKLGWLPQSQTRSDPAGVSEVDLSDSFAPLDNGSPDAEPAATVDPRSQAVDLAAAPQQHEPHPAADGPATTDPWADLPASVTNPPEVKTAAVAHQPASQGGNPFGPADLEFVPADTFAREPEARPTDSAQRFPADPGMIQQVAGVESGEPEVTAAALLGPESPPNFPQPQQAPKVDWASIDRMINDGQDVEAHRLLSSMYWEQPDLREKMRDRIEQTAMRIYFLPQPHYVDPYEVRGGDLLQTIARKYDVSWQYIAKLNRTDPLKIRVGQKLKVIQGPFGAVIDLRRFELTVHAHGYFVARFPIGVGKDGSTPVGEFSVQDKLENPTYYGPDGVVAADDPQNPLGEFWMSIGDGYGIHGTIDETSIGRAESRGCLRLKNQDIADLYDLLTVGSPIVIRR
ncbi:MAG: L,D-transpeptidase family protein [Planctomycetaceae bacterium]|nr:L,D-transpeptidase family protein [Planctomycetaceae bacterium]